MTTINWNDSSAKVSKYFTVGEVTQNDPRRIPARNSQEEKNILTLAVELDKLREAWGSPVKVTSWYRPIAVNREVGGVSNSQHITGNAADVYPANGDDLNFEAFVSRHWGGGVGLGMESGRGFTHVDLRQGGWRRGPATLRWNY